MKKLVRLLVFGLCLISGVRSLVASKLVWDGFLASKLIHDRFLAVCRDINGASVDIISKRALNADSVLVVVHEKAFGGGMKFIEADIEKGIVVEKGLSKRDRALLWAINNGFFRIAKVLIKLGADLRFGYGCDENSIKGVDVKLKGVCVKPVDWQGIKRFEEKLLKKVRG